MKYETELMARVKGHQNVVRPYLLPVRYDVKLEEMLLNTRTRTHRAPDRAA